MAPFGVLNKVRGMKPGASIIAEVSDDGGKTKLPALAVQRFGNGRVGAVMIGDLWHWGLKDEANHRDMDKAWRQLMRWLVTDVPGKTELVAEQKPGDPNQAVRLQVRVRDKKFQPLDNATVTLHVRPVGQSVTNAIRLTAEASATQAGVYEATYVPRETGGYRTRAMITDATSMEAGRARPAGLRSRRRRIPFAQAQPRVAGNHRQEDRRRSHLHERAGILCQGTAQPQGARHRKLDLAAMAPGQRVPFRARVLRGRVGIAKTARAGVRRGLFFIRIRLSANVSSLHNEVGIDL